MEDKTIKSTENYLDNLLNSMNGMHEEMDDTVQENTQTDTSSQDEFLRQFEKELESEAYDEYFSEFESDLANDTFAEKQSDITEPQIPYPADSDVSLEEVLMQNEKNKSFTIPQEVPVEDADRENRNAINELNSAMEMFDNNLENDEDDFVLDEIPSDEINMNSFQMNEEEIEKEPALDEEPFGEDIADKDINDKDINEKDINAEKISDEDMTVEDIAGEDIADGNIQQNTQMQSEELPLTDIGEPDLAGNSDADLIDLLNKGGLADLGDMLSDDPDVTEDNGENEFEQFAEKEMESKDITNSQENGDNAAPKEKKKGFFAKILEALFKERVSDPQADEEQSQANTAEALSAENQQILNELDSASAPKKKEKKKKAKKEKPPKKPKEPKPKKEKKPKEKKPKEVDNSPKLPKGPVIVISVFAASLFAFVIICTNLLGNMNSITNAKKLYNDAFAAIQENDTSAFTKCIDAYSNMSGLKLKGENEATYEKLEILASVSEKYESHQAFRNSGKEDMALDSIVCAAGRCQINDENAKEKGCVDALNGMKAIIADTLTNEYNMSYDEAVELYKNKNRKEYSLLIMQKLKDLGFEEETK